MANQPETPGRTGPLEIGATLLKWEIRGLLGKGGHAWVYHGYDTFLDRHVAIKIIPTPPQAEPERDLRQRAQREARVLSKLENENVVRLIDAGFTTDGSVYIVMEILRGRTWRDVIHAVGTFNVIEALSLGAKVADGVQAAHGVKVIHRDLKPENVFVIENNGVKVLDFGIAKLFGPGAATTQRDLLHGTMKYMSPEHLQGLGVSERSDIYALGTMLYEALCGCIPCMIGVQDPTTNALIYAQLNRMPPLLDELVPTVPRFVARAIHRMLAKAPEDRFASMAEVGEVLRAHSQRYLQESNGRAPAARELWHFTPAPQPESAVRLSNATTELHQLSDLSPPTAPPVTLPTPQAQDTTPVSKPPFSAPGLSTRPGMNAQVTQPIHIITASPPTRPSPAPVPLAATNVPESSAPLPPMTPHAEAPAPLSQAAFRPAPSGPHSSRPNSEPARDERAQGLGKAHASEISHSVPVPALRRERPATPKSSATRNLLLLGFPLGAAMGLIVGVMSYWHPRPTPPASTVEEPIVVVSTQPPLPAEPPAPTEPAASAPVVVPDVEATPLPTTTAAVTAQSTAVATAPKPAAAVLPAPTAHAVAKSTTKPPIAMPASGLWDMSELDAPAKSKSKPAPAASAKPPRSLF